MVMQATEQNAPRRGASSNGRPAATDVLIHMHLPKTGGTSLSSMVKHGFKNDEVFEWTRHGVNVYSALSVATPEASQQQLAAFGLDRIRYLSGHVPFGVHRVFDRPARYITVLRNPVERVVSSFYWQKQIKNPFLKHGRPLTFEEYVEDRCDINLIDYQ